MRGDALCTLFLLPVLCTSVRSAASPSALLLRAALTARRLVDCSYSSAGDPWPAEGLWEAGATLEGLADIEIATSSAPFLNTTAADFAGIAYATFIYTPPVTTAMCNDGQLWWALAWIRAANAAGDDTPHGTAYIERAAQIFDFVIDAGVEPSKTLCGGGVAQCAAPAAPYKNAITSELFITASMYLHPFAQRLGRSTTYYLSWAEEMWSWFAASGMINSAGLVNDGLDSTSCANNNKTTWTYNQGVVLDGLALLSAAANDPSIADAAWGIANATMRAMTDRGVLVEPCAGGGSGCAQDQLVFKGEFARHLARFAALYGPEHRAAAAAITAFLQTNARSMLANAVVQNSVQPRPAWHGDYALDWRGGSPNPGTIGTASSGVSLLTAAALVGAEPDTAQFYDLGLGNCADDAGGAMPSCFLWTLSEKGCITAALALEGAVAYDYTWHCDGQLMCRIRSLSASSAACTALPHNYPATFGFEAGNATNVTTVVPASNTICVLAGAPVRSSA